MTKTAKPARPAKPKQKERSLAKGIAAGLLGGLAGAVALTFAQRIFASRSTAAAQPLAPDTAPSTGAALTIARPAADFDINAIPWGYGAITGAAYGALAEFFPAATSKDGASFGMTLEALAQQGAIPALGVVARERKATPSDAAADITAHVAFGVTTEWVRRIIRKLL
jgi:putative membrane protein